MKKKKNNFCGIRNFEKEEKKIVSMTKSSIKIAYPTYWLGLNIVKDVIGLLAEDTLKKHDNNTGKNSKVFLILINRSVQHTESIRILIERGFYGDSFSLTRNIMSDIAMMQYLHFHQELLDLYINEKQDDYQRDKDFKKAFNETIIEKELVGKGIPSFGSSFKLLSKVSHSSAFGSQLYGSNGKNNNQYHLNYGPKFQPEKALILFNIAISSYYDLVNIVLWHRHHAKEEIETKDWNKVKINLEKLGEEIEVHTKCMSDYIKIFFKK